MLQNILEGYQVPAVGTIIVADEDKIIASNNTDFTGQKTADNDIALLLYSAIAGTCMLQSKNAEKKRKKLELKKEIEYNRREYKNKKEQFDRVVELLSKMKCVV